MAKKKFELNRKDYLNIKKMDHHQMSLWAESMYKSALRMVKKRRIKLASHLKNYIKHLPA